MLTVYLRSPLLGYPGTSGERVDYIVCPPIEANRAMLDGELLEWFSQNVIDRQERTIPKAILQKYDLARALCDALKGA